MARNRTSEATWAARMLPTEVGRGIRDARLAGGISLRTAAASVGPANRRVLGLHGGDLRTTFPLFGRAVLTALDQRRRPTSNGIIVLRRWAQRDG